MEQWLNQDSLRGWSEEQLTQYREHLIETMANCVIYLDQVNNELDNRKYDNEWLN